MANFNKNRTWGVEIEFMNTRELDINKVIKEINDKGVRCFKENYNHVDKNYWKMVYDSSVESQRQGEYGHELVSPPLKGDEGFRQLKIVTEVLKANNAKINKTCGLHVHHDAHDFTVYTFKNLFALYTMYEGAIDSMMPESRREQKNNYCSSIRVQRYETIITPEDIQIRLNEIKKCKTFQDLVKIYGDSDSARYYKLNLRAFTRHGTIEFRQHSGTIEYDKIENWIILTSMMVERSMSQVAYKYDVTRDTFYDFSRRICLYEQCSADELAVKARKFYQARIKSLVATAGAEVAA